MKTATTKATKSAAKPKTPKAVIAQTIEVTAPAKKLSKAQQAKVDKLFGQQTIQNDDVEQAMDTPVHQYYLSEEHRKAERRKTSKPSAMDFAVQQLSAPKAPEFAAPKLAAPKPALDEFNKRLAELKQEFNIPQNVKIAGAQRISKTQQNGITRPNATSLCGQIWQICDELTRDCGEIATVKMLKQQPELQDVNDHTIKTQYARWRKFNGITGRISNLAVGEYDGLTPIK